MFSSRVYYKGQWSLGPTTASSIQPKTLDLSKLMQTSQEDLRAEFVVSQGIRDGVRLTEANFKNVIDYLNSDKTITALDFSGVRFTHPTEAMKIIAKGLVKLELPRADRFIVNLSDCALDSDFNSGAKPPVEFFTELKIEGDKQGNFELLRTQLRIDLSENSLERSDIDALEKVSEKMNINLVSNFMTRAESDRIRAKYRASVHTSVEESKRPAVPAASSGTHSDSSIATKTNKHGVAAADAARNLGGKKARVEPTYDCNLILGEEDVSIEPLQHRGTALARAPETAARVTDDNVRLLPRPNAATAAAAAAVRFSAAPDQPNSSGGSSQEIYTPFLHRKSAGSNKDVPIEFKLQPEIDEHTREEKEYWDRHHAYNGFGFWKNHLAEKAHLHGHKKEALIRAQQALRENREVKAVSDLTKDLDLATAGKVGSKTKKLLEEVVQKLKR